MEDQDKKAAETGDPAQTVIDAIREKLDGIGEQDIRLVVMLSGVAGAGKTTIAKAVLEAVPNFQRFSIDEIIAERHGLWDEDYAPEQYAGYLEEADGIYLEEYKRTLADRRKDVILDRSFYCKEDRDEYRAIAEKVGATCMLVHLKAEADVLWRRICTRREAGMDANSAREIPQELLKRFLDGFEEPHGEGEVVIQIL